ncbi:MAG: phosphotransferase family protein [Halobacteriaceae archaeon]
MPRDIEAVLASQADEYAVHRQLHDVPPHAVYEVTVDGRRAVCKLARGPEADPATDAAVLAYVGRETSVPVPAVLASGEEFFLAEFCERAPESGTAHEYEAPTLTADLARTLGEGLATLHAETPFERTGVPRADGGLAVDSHGTWADTLAAQLDAWRETLAEYGRADAAREVRAFVREHAALFEGAGRPALTHNWYTPEHVGVDDGEVACVVDWEHALVAPGEFEVARTALVLFERTTEAGAEAAFREAYESVHPIPEGFDVRRRAYRAVHLVYFLVSGWVQARRPPAERERLSERFEDEIRETLAGLRAEL